MTADDLEAEFQRHGLDAATAHSATWDQRQADWSAHLVAEARGRLARQHPLFFSDLFT